MKALAAGLRAWLLGAGLLCAGWACADTPCRIAYDMGSSGIRAGANQAPGTAQTDIDFLAPLWAGRDLDEVLPATISALQGLPMQAQLPVDCQRVGGGFSAWRLAWQQNPQALTRQLAEIAERSGVSVLVIPQSIEGRYGYRGAKLLLGSDLQTSHILDIGGGSLQVAGENSSFGLALGQKAWRRELCLFLRGAEACAIGPMTARELARARALAFVRLQALAGRLAGPVSLTAISRPVTRGVAPAVAKFSGQPQGAEGISRARLSAAIEQLAVLNEAEAAVRLQTPPKYLAFLLSDMLLVEAILRSTGVNHLKTTELDLTNLPGLLADDQAYRWSAHYACYLERLRHMGLPAYASDPATCAP